MRTHDLKALRVALRADTSVAGDGLERLQNAMVTKGRLAGSSGTCMKSALALAGLSKKDGDTCPPHAGVNSSALWDRLMLA